MVGSGLAYRGCFLAPERIADNGGGRLVGAGDYDATVGAGGDDCRQAVENSPSPGSRAATVAIAFLAGRRCRRVVGCGSKDP